LQSVIKQDYPHIEYIVIDGGSTDGSLDIIKKYEDKLHYWISEKDNGMYDAINKGFARSSGDIMCWINSDDILAKGALKYIAELFTNHNKVQWLMGYPTLIDEKSEITWQGQDAQVFSPYFFYLHNHLRNFSFIQQESTFWTRTLWNKAGGSLNLKYSMASDFDLWLRFFKYEKLYFSHQQLAAFRRRKGQLSENQEKYLIETNLAVSKNQKTLPVHNKLNIFILKILRKILFSLKIKNTYYLMFSKILGTPNWID